MIHFTKHRSQTAVQWPISRHVVVLSACLLTLFIYLSLYRQVSAMGETDILTNGNQLYEKGDYQAAAQLYEQLVSQNIADSTLYFNLGNAYYKQGELGRAILNYIRAAHLAPRDADIRANLSLARSQVVDKYETDSQMLIGGMLTWIREAFSLDELAITAIGLWSLSALLWVVHRHGHSDRGRDAIKYALIGVAPLLFASVLALGGILYNEKARSPSIVVASEIKVVSGPGEQYNTEFTLHQGAPVSLLEIRGNWARIALPGDQIQGWTPTMTVERISR